MDPGDPLHSRRARWVAGVDALATAAAALLVGADEDERAALLRAVDWPDLTASEVADSATSLISPLLTRLAQAERWTMRQAIEWARWTGRAEAAASVAIDERGMER